MTPGIFTLLLALAGPAPAAADDAATLVERGRVFLELKEFGRAADLYREALALAPDDVEIEFLLALATYGAGNVVEAEPLLVAVTKSGGHDPQDPLPFEFLGRLYFEAGRFDAARDALQRAVEIDPTNAKLVNQLGSCQIRLGDADAALGSFRRAAAIAPDYGVARYNAGVVLAATGRKDEAIDELTVAATLLPADPDPPATIAELALELGRVEDGERFGRMAASRAPADAHLRFALGKCFEEHGDPCAAEIEYQAAAAAAPDDVAPPRALARGETEFLHDSPSI